MTAGRSLADAFQELEGEELSSVEFVRDYVQLRFDGPVLNAFNPHHITSQLPKISWGEPCYCDALCKLIGRKVQKVSLAEHELAFTFDHGVVWTMSLRDEDYNGPEALYFDNGAGCWVI